MSNCEKSIDKKAYRDCDKIAYPSRFSKIAIIDALLCSEEHFIRCYLRALRLEEYYTFYSPNKWLKYYYKRKKNLLGCKLGFFIAAGCFGKGLKIYHYGSVIVNPKARIGENCTLHGNCCIGSKGGFPDDSPVIADNVDIGQNAQVLGGITVASGVKIGAGAIVTKSVLTPYVTLVGIPARIVSKID